MNKYQEFMRGIVCDECPLYHNGFCNDELGEENEENLSCGEILFRYLNNDEEEK